MGSNPSPIYTQDSNKYGIEFLLMVAYPMGFAI